MEKQTLKKIIKALIFSDIIGLFWDIKGLEEGLSKHHQVILRPLYAQVGDLFSTGKLVGK